MTILYNTDIPVIMICSRKPRLTQPYKSITNVYYTAILRDTLMKTGVIPTTRAWLISLVILKGFSRTKNTNGLHPQAMFRKWIIRCGSTAEIQGLRCRFSLCIAVLDADLDTD